ncbi:site-specific integrase [Mycobacteroides immunogenum]|uniref:tyrosine-type recombinase/integrase n=1 Tax=Mycobacteroides immunogenum TaxID=83262 RepID=UPI0025B77D19|nr:site-specific integrase [Mycobacteroides immunogenum]WJR34067.1 site-specific integrase [Mycobacteroides immunogenum]
MSSSERRNLPPQVRRVLTSTGQVRYEVRVDLARGRANRGQSKKRFHTLREAKEYLNPILGDQERGLHVSPSQLTVKAAVEKWLKSQRIRPTTRAAYTAALRPVVDELGSRSVQSITKDDVEALVEALQEGTTDRGVWANTSINPMLARWRAMFDDLHKQGVLSRNVVQLVKSVKRAEDTPAPRGATLTPAQIRTLLTFHKGKHDELLIHFALLGLRRGELAALRWSDLTAKELIVSRNRTTDGSQVYEGDTKTASGERTLPIPSSLQKRLRVLRASHGTNDYVLNQQKSPGRAYHPRTLDRRWADALRRAGVPRVRLHDARHTTATHLHALGVPLADVAAWLGHANAAVTARVYSHSTKRGLAAASKALEW